MDELFFAYSSSVSNVEVEIPTEGKCIEPGGWSNTLNTDIRYCKIMPCSVNGTSLLKEALRYSDDISIAINVAKAESVNDKKVCPPMNAVLRDGMSEQIVETGLFPPKRVAAPVPKWDDGDVDVLPPVMYGPPVIVGRKENPIKRLIGDILLIASLIAIVVFVCFIVFKTKGEGSDANHSSSSSTQKEIKKIENKRDRNNYLFILQNELPKQDRGIHERTDGEFHNPIPQSVESRNTATPTEPVYDPQGNNGDASAEQSPHQQTSVERP